VGNASDIALLRFCECFVPTDRVRQEYPIQYEIPFSSEFKWQLSITKDLDQKVDDQNNAKYVVMLKGAPERILLLCSTYQDRFGVLREIDEIFKQKFQEAYERFGNEGKRVIGYCERYFEAPKNIQFSSE
jgi:sodium/potassium-transporting ATPase subunit alpha